VQQQKSSPITKLPIDIDYTLEMLEKLLEIPSPSGYTNTIITFVTDELKCLGIEFDITRRGAIRARLPGVKDTPARAIVAHVDTLGAMVSERKANGRLALRPIGTWSSHFAEGARVTIFTDRGARRGTVIPIKASGHVYNEEIDTLEVSWDTIEVRVDDYCSNAGELAQAGFNVGDFIAFDTNFEVTPNGFINSRHLDDKVGVAVELAVAKAVVEQNIVLPIDCFLLFTIFEEVGSGASAVLHGHVSEMVSIDNATPAPGQSSTEFDVSICMMDQSCPFDFHLSHLMIELSRHFGVKHQRDVFKYYRCDSASALEAGNDIRTALLGFGVDASHGYERTHQSSIQELGALLLLYLQSPPVVWRDRNELGSMEGFPEQPVDY
jgi:peptidase M42 family hydrolase